jgi:hypothetical protein
MIGDDCNCYDQSTGSIPGAPSSIGKSCQIRCESGYRPSGTSCGCVPESTNPSGNNTGVKTLTGQKFYIKPGFDFKMRPEVIPGLQNQKKPPIKPIK